MCSKPMEFERADGGTAHRWFFKCPKCRKPFAADLPVNRTPYSSEEENAKWYAQTSPCPHCQHVPTRERETPYYGGSLATYRTWHRAMGCVMDTQWIARLEHRCACDARCTGATGPNCECSCGGKNHGTGRVVEIAVPVARVPQTA